jgi:hypothetical protein
MSIGGDVCRKTPDPLPAFLPEVFCARFRHLHHLVSLWTLYN